MNYDLNVRLWLNNPIVIVKDMQFVNGLCNSMLDRFTLRLTHFEIVVEVGYKHGKANPAH